MPVTNEILPFAPQATVALSEILSLAEYTADSQRLRGNQPGIARLELVNTVLKQTSHMTAGSRSSSPTGTTAASKTTETSTPSNPDCRRRS